MQIQAIGAERATSTREIKAYSTVARPGCYMTAEERQEYRSIVESSELHDSAKRILKWLIGFKTPDMSLSIDAIRDRLPKATKRDHEAATEWVNPQDIAPNAKNAIMGRETVKRVLRMIDDERGGIAVLRMVAKEKRGSKVPRVYEIDLTPITEKALMAIAGRATEHEKTAHLTAHPVAHLTAHLTAHPVAHLTAHLDSPLTQPTLGSGLSSGPLLLKNNAPSCIHRAEVATERLPAGVDLSAMSRFSAKVIQFQQRHLDGQAFGSQGKASLSSASFDEVNAELRAACDEPAFSMAARSAA